MHNRSISNQSFIGYGVKMLAFLIICLPKATSAQTGTHYSKIHNGILVPLNASKTQETTGKTLRLQFITDKILRVSVSPTEQFSDTSSLMIIDRQPADIPFTIQPEKNHPENLLLQSAGLQAVVNEETGSVQFRDASGHPLLKETDSDPHGFKPVSIAQPGYYSVRQSFENIQNSSLYGLGGNQLGYTDLKDKDLDMIQYNSNVFVPFLVSSGKFAILWDNNSITHFGDTLPYSSLSHITLYDEAGNPGGLTATYLQSTDFSAAAEDTKQDKEITRVEQGIDYQFAGDSTLLPTGFKPGKHSLVTWTGYIQPKESGLQKFLLKFGGYIQVWIDGKELTNWWRQSWNPAEQPFELQMNADRKYKLKVVWKPDGTNAFASLKWKRPIPASMAKQINFRSEAGRQIDYYFIHGQNIDSLISGYRKLTGKAPILPKWAYGFWQSRERYNSQKEILETAAAFREKKIPLDNIVQDWFYWKNDQWGSQEFDPSRYPDPAAMIDSLHQAYNLHFMISVWPKFYENTPPFKRFWDHDWLYKQNILDRQKDWVGYVSTFYDAFNPEASQAFWQLVNEKIYQKGVDAWWLDATEPDIVDNITNEKRMRLMTPTQAGAPQINFNAYALANEAAFYNGQRKVSPDKRVFILTRSAYAGSQRYSATTWSGDIGATWKEMKNQIATGISFSMSGIPYWSMDIGGFAVEDRYHNPNSKDLEEWRELQTRWFQFGAFVPIFRSHGQAPAREMFNIAPETHPAYQSMLYYDKLRYRLMPYIYSIGAATYLHNYTIMRGLVMDFPQDSIARQSKEEYLFGPDLLIAPVHTYGARKKAIYLPTAAPDGNKPTGWYDLYAGKYYEGGQQITVPAPYGRIPVFVKAGAILPFGKAQQYTDEHLNDTITLRLYKGANGQFTLYEDQGLNNGYEKGQYSTIQFEYQEKTSRLTIHESKGNYNSPVAKQLKSRVFQVICIDPAHPGGIDDPQENPILIKYTGQEKTIAIP